MRKALAWGLSFAVLVVSLAGAGALLGATASEGASFPRLISNCDTADGWIHDAGNGSVSLDTEVKNEGTGSVKVELTNWLYLMRGVGPESAYDFSGAKYFCFDLWVDEGETDLFTAASDCGINFASDGSYTNGGFAIPAAELKALELHAGWNQVALPLPEVTESVTADITKINTMRLYSTSNNAGRTVRFDNVRLEKQKFPVAISDCDTADGWIHDAGNGSVSLDTEVKNEGTGSVKVELTNWLYLMRGVGPESAYDFSGAKYFCFDLWVDEGETDLFTAASDCGINFASDGSYTNGGFAIPAAELKALELHAGWNQVALPLPEVTESVTADITKINTMRLYSTSNNAGRTVRFDNVRLTDSLPEPPTEEDDSKYQFMSNCDDLDGWDFDAGNGSLSLDTEEKRQGSASLKATLTNSLFLFRRVDPEYACDFTGKAYLAFDMWIDEGCEDIFTSAADCGINLTSDGSVDQGGFSIPSQSLKALELKQGWNEIVLPLPDMESESVTADVTKITTMRFYSLSNKAGKVLRFDNFRLLKEEAEEPGDEEDKYKFINNCDDLHGWEFDAGNGSLSLDTEEKRQGSASLKATLTNSLFLFRRVDPEYACDFTGKAYLAFDMWIDEGCEDIFTSAADCGINLTSDGSVDQGGFSIPSQSLKALELKQGWNEIVLPLPDMESESVTADVTKITTMRFYSLSSKAGKVLRFDNFRLLTEEPGDEEDK